VKPDRRGDESKGESREARNERSRKGGEQEDSEVEGGDIHLHARRLR
jgi:hypothetical protein